MKRDDDSAQGNPGEDELVPLSEVAKELGWPMHKVRLAMGEVGDRVRMFPGQSLGREDRRVKRYPRSYTVALLKEGVPEEPDAFPDLTTDERVPFDRIIADLGWARNTVKRYMAHAGRLLHVFPDPEDGRKKLYPLQHTLKILRREHARVQARRLRSNDEAAAHWAALAQLKVASDRLKKLSREVATAAREVRDSYEALRHPPRSEVEIYTLPGGLALVRPLSVLVSPLRLVYWKAVVPEISLRGEGRSAEEAVRDLREKIASIFRQLEGDPSLNSELWEFLNTFVRVRRPRTKSGSVEKSI